MKKVLLLLSTILIVLLHANASTEDSTTTDSLDTAKFTELLNRLAQIDTSFKKGVVDIGNNLAQIKVPEGYKFLDAENSKYVLHDIWGNPPSDGTLGLLFPDSCSIIGDGFTYAVEITYSDDGHIDDDDAEDIDYDDLLEELQNDAKEGNPERVKQGYAEVQIIGWASQPFYDATTKKLHWAQEAKFGNDSINTLNYNIRVLGRSGYLNLNVIGSMTILPEVKKDINKIISSAEFKDGNKYSDFDSNIDKVAAYGIGGLVAGKVLAKVGFFGIILKFLKFIVIGVVGFFGLLWKKLFGKKSDDTPSTSPNRS